MDTAHFFEKKNWVGSILLVVGTAALATGIFTAACALGASPSKAHMVSISLGTVWGVFVGLAPYLRGERFGAWRVLLLACLALVCWVIWRLPL